MTIGDTYWLSVLSIIQWIFIAIATIAFLSVPRLGRKDYFGLGLMIFLSLSIETIADIGVFVFHKNMNAVCNFYSVFNLPFAIIFYQRRIEGLTKTITAIIIGVFVILALLNYFFLQGIHGIDSYTSTVDCIGLMCLSVAYFAALFFQHSVNHTVRGMFWINSAILIYFSGTFFLNLLIDYLLNFLHNDLIIIWMIRNSLGLIFYGLLTHGLIKVRREYLSHIIAI